jgi:signal transduction histidine kinase
VEFELELGTGAAKRTLHIALCPGPAEQGQALRVFGNIRDLSAERDAHEARLSFDTMTAELESVIAIAAHDLRAPMRNITLLVEMLRDGFVDHGDNKLQYINLIEKVSTKSMKLVSEVLAQARTTVPRSMESRFSFAALAQDIYDVLDPFESHCLSVSPAEAVTDRTAMQVVLRGLLAAMLQRAKGQCLNLRITLSASADQMLEVTLSDDGPALSHSALMMLNDDHLSPPQGVGLLSLRRIVLARGGSLQVHRGKGGEGGQVQFTLPGTLALPDAKMIGNGAHFAILNHARPTLPLRPGADLGHRDTKQGLSPAQRGDSAGDWS